MTKGDKENVEGQQVILEKVESEINEELKTQVLANKSIDNNDDNEVKEELYDVFNDDEEVEENVNHENDNDNLTEISGNVEDLKEELKNIVVVPPLNPRYIAEDKPLPNHEEFPASYKSNKDKEKMVLIYAENFARQYFQLYSDRKPLLLNPINECGIEKFVCTTIKPTLLPYKPLYDWNGCAEFVADYLDFVKLDPEHEPPKRLLSPPTVIKRQKGNCFEYSTVLVSLLIAAGYDAYVVSGYATREVCIMDETREECPLLKKKKPEAKKEERAPIKRYQVKPAKDLQSKYELKMKKRKEDAEKAEKIKLAEEEELKDIEAHKPPKDELYSLRVHSWVLVLAGQRGVEENFFIEPFTGLAKSTHDTEYLGIESVWNNKNYWVNMQLCNKEGLINLSFDLDDCSLWEFILPMNKISELKLPNSDDLNHETFEHDEDEQEDEEEIERHLDLPKSWVSPIELSYRDFQTRCPAGKKSKFYKRAKLEHFAPYLMGDGIICRLSSFSDRQLIDLMESKEIYKHRADKLQNRSCNHKTNLVTENFGPGRLTHLIQHIYKSTDPGPETEREMIFDYDARVDGLEKRVETPNQMIEFYVNRQDFLIKRDVLFKVRQKTFGPASEGMTPRTILKIVDYYDRNVNLNADKDIKILTFNCQEKKIYIRYHTKESKIASSTREFAKPENWDDKTAPLIFHDAEMHSTFQIETRAKKSKQVELYHLLEDLLKKEEKCKEAVRNSEKEVRDILDNRFEEENNIKLDVSVYDVERNDKAKKLRQELERRAKDEKLRQEEMDVDYLAPFLSYLDNQDNITQEDAIKLYDECLRDLKRRLIDKANLIQARFEKETAELQNKQQWYQQNQVQMQTDDVNTYLAYCSEAMFKIHILQLRLDRHKELAPSKYMELQQKLKKDPRLAHLLRGHIL